MRSPVPGFLNPILSRMEQTLKPCMPRLGLFAFISLNRIWAKRTQCNTFLQFHLRVREESRLHVDQPEYVLLLSWHIADELIPKLREKGYKGKYIVPLPEPRVV